MPVDRRRSHRMRSKFNLLVLNCRLTLSSLSVRHFVYSRHSSTKISMCRGALPAFHGTPGPPRRAVRPFIVRRRSDSQEQATEAPVPWHAVGVAVRLYRQRVADARLRFAHPRCRDKGRKEMPLALCLSPANPSLLRMPPVKAHEERLSTLDRRLIACRCASRGRRHMFHVTLSLLFA